jgi:hypothetical protein
LQVWHGSQITAAISNSSTAEQLEALIAQHIDSMNAINLSAAIMKLSRDKVQQPKPYAVCVRHYLQFATTDCTRHLSNVVYALCQAPQDIRQQHQAALQEQLVPAFMAKCAEANAQDISNVLYGMADSGQQLADEAVQQLLAVFVSQLYQATPQSMSNTLWAVAKLGQQVPAGQLQQLLRALVGQLHQATPQGVSNMLWAVATMGQQVPAGQLQQLLNALVGQLHQANSQNISNTLWAVASMGQQVPASQLQQLLDALVGQLRYAKPQEVSNTLWAVATMGQQVPAGQLQQLLHALVGQLHRVNPQDVSNTLWAVATMGQQVPAGQLQQLLDALVGQLHQAKPQNMSNTLWAVATMGQQVPAGQLQQLLDAFVPKLQHATPQEVSNALLACAKLGFLPQRLLAAPGLAGLLQAGNTQNLAIAAWACGELGHRDEQLMAALLAEVQQRLAVAGTSSNRSFNSQNLCNLCWAVAVLDLQQHAQQVLQLGKACSSIWSSIEVEGQQQMWQVHTWLLDFDLVVGQGLQGSLTQQQLQQCRAAWDQEMRKTAKQQHTSFQRSVLAAVQRLPLTWQQQPQMEQLSVGSDGVTPDGALLIDVAGRTADGMLVAVEADGPTHFRQPDGELKGRTRYRNRALAVRGYRLVSVPWMDWRKASKDEQCQDQYLLQLFGKAGLVGGLQTTTTSRQPPTAAAAAAAAATVGAQVPAAAVATGSAAEALAKALLRKGRLPVRESPQVMKQHCRLLLLCMLHVV